MMKLVVRHNEQPIKTLNVGETLNIPGLYVSNMQEGWSLYIEEPNGSLAAGLYDVIMVEEVEPEPTIEQIRAAMPPLTPRQFRLGWVLSAEDRTVNQISDLIDSIEDSRERQIARINWDAASTFYRLDTFVVGLSAQMGITPEQLDTMWLSAAQL